jgi:hypothetical protein
MTRTLNDHQLTSLLKEMNRADMVEIKLTVAESDFGSAVDALDLDPLDARMRQVVFFDTPDLALYSSGIVVRARRSQGGGGDTVVKLRPLPSGVGLREDQRPRGLVVEVDAMPGGFVCSGSLKATTTATEVRRVVRGQAKVGSLFSKSQKAFLRQHARADLKVNELSVLGPITTLKLRFEPQRLGRPMVAELWLYPDGTKILELSTKSAPSQAFQVAAEARVYLAERGVGMNAEQQTKTIRALRYFASRVPIPLGTPADVTEVATAS